MAKKSSRYHVWLPEFMANQYSGVFPKGFKVIMTKDSKNAIEDYNTHGGVVAYLDVPHNKEELWDFNFKKDTEFRILDLPKKRKK